MGPDHIVDQGPTQIEYPALSGSGVMYRRAPAVKWSVGYVRIMNLALSGVQGNWKRRPGLKVVLGLLEVLKPSPRVDWGRRKMSRQARKMYSRRSFGSHKDSGQTTPVINYLWQNPTELEGAL